MNAQYFAGKIEAAITWGPRTASVRSVQYCDVYRLDREAFDRVLSRYPGMAAQIEAMAKERQLRV